MNSRKPCDFPHVLGYGSKITETSALEWDAEAPATPEQWAAIPFEPWERDLSLLPTKREWYEAADTHLVYMRFALALLWMTKEQLIETAAENPAEMIGVYEQIEVARMQFKSFEKIANTARLRLLSSLTAVDLRSQGEEAGSCN